MLFFYICIRIYTLVCLPFVKKRRPGADFAVLCATISRHYELEGGLLVAFKLVLDPSRVVLLLSKLETCHCFKGYKMDCHVVYKQIAAICVFIFMGQSAAGVFFVVITISSVLTLSKPCCHFYFSMYIFLTGLVCMIVNCFMMSSAYSRMSVAVMLPAAT